MIDDKAHIPTKMRAMQWSSSKGGVENNLQLNTAADMPKLTSRLPKDHLLVKVAYASLNPVDHKFPDALPFLFTKPATPCLDFSGTVEAISTLKPSTAPFQIGQRICGRTSPVQAGAMAKYVVVPAVQCVKVPEMVGLDQAACAATVGITSYCSLKPYVKAGHRVLINGASGGTGTFGIQIAKALGATYGKAVCSTANAHVCISLGADEVLDYKTQDVAQSLRNSGEKFDLIVDNVSFDLFWSCASFLRPQGTYASPALTPLFRSFFHILQAKLLPSFCGGVPRNFHVVGARDDVDTLEQIIKWIERGTIRVHIHKEYALEDGMVAMRDFKAGHTAGKLVVKVS
jgi:NADPH:quinone reductase-like Zn-dependent oxidoreductase